jgi:hypothetical protein
MSVEYHSRQPMYGDDTALTDCSVLGGDCYADGGSWGVQEFFEPLIRAGDAEEIVAELARRYNANTWTSANTSDDDDDEEPAVCRTEGCEEDPGGGEGWEGFCGNCADRRYAQETANIDPEQDTAPSAALDTVSGEVQIVLAPTPDVPINSVGALEDLESWFDGDGEMRYGISTGDIRHDNGRRAGFAAAAVLAYARRICHLSTANDEMPETVISDLLADLRHLSDALGLDYAESDVRGDRDYEAEVRGEI